jgi:omega-amidase
MEDLKITLVQVPLHWENEEKNLEQFDSCLTSILPFQTDLIILPEMFNTGFTMNSKGVYNTMNSEIINWMKKTAENKKAVVTGSMIICEKDQFYNRLLWVDAEGKVQTYDKRHLFRMADEHKVFSPGKTKLIVQLKGWKICPLICYDLRFPVWSRNNNTYDLLIYVANWPEKRSYAWKNLLVARAIENQAYVAGVNRTGIDGLGVEYAGGSLVAGPMGEIIRSTFPNEACIETVELSAEVLTNFRNIFPAHLDADHFSID